MPDDPKARTYAANRPCTTGIQTATSPGDRVGIGASVIQIFGCQDNQVSLEGDQNGLLPARC